MNLDAELSRRLPGVDPELQRSALSGLWRHGDAPAWRAAFEALPDLTPSVVSLGPVRIGAQADASDDERAALIRSLQALRPWRKGPFELFGVPIDTEWRSDWKWDRVRPHVADLRGRRVLDVGCGNGYFGWRMIDAGADCVIGVILR
ncbi:MAG: DUF1698 domain-containing protein [Gammaproteobacteria bacterium]|nr:DUF1698 domain-containing protein [Gammaproteobacteria bacterium]